MSCSTNSRTRLELHCDLEGDFIGEDLDVMEMYACANVALGELGVSDSFYMISADVLGQGCDGLSTGEGDLGTPIGPEPKEGLNILDTCFGDASTVSYEAGNALPHYVEYKGTQCYLNSSPHCGQAKQFQSRAPWCDACSVGNTCPYENPTCSFNGGSCPSFFTDGGGLNQNFPIGETSGGGPSSGGLHGPSLALMFPMLMAVLRSFGK